MTENVYWVLTCRVNDGQVEALGELAGEMTATTEADEPGTVAYEWHLSDDGGRLIVYERYTDSAAAMVHVGNFVSQFAQRFMGCVSAESMVVFGQPSEELRSALGVLSPTYMTQFAGFVR